LDVDLIKNGAKEKIEPLSESNFNIVSVARVSAEKGIPRTIEVLAKLKELGLQLNPSEE
jgi:glycosyltransferase involved in cell wall biosynthesis